ncbi:carboxypeptidase regulatory-like domain-containing protein [Cyclobacterium plantarum]|uniref:Carboxypeptidase regulatory-like domain-containing protein n=1 Tax=Cyclobacterium plantarum TaxID=2716263 RepID=A0ABX0HAW3_9BACT|nr:carboxypeptidase regulatory-like domain-containing protein [Cyclobacterium plantarum]NHE58986.1 hypothetical protein [Cyclobacterium plantarum]
MFASCNEEEETVGSTLAGAVVNTTGIGVAGATVSLWRSGESIANYTSTTDVEGNYNLINVLNGDYELRIRAAGYEDYSVNITVGGNNVDRSDTIRGTALISGQIINSQTGQGLSGAEVTFSADGDTTRMEADLVVTTDELGYYIIDGAPVGVFIQVVRNEGFYPQVQENVAITEGENELNPVTAVEGVAEGALRIVLTWGVSPGDLDSHLTGPSSNGRFHCYFSSKNPVSEVNLDVDDVTSFGPETITISEFTTGTYRYSVHNYSNWSESGSEGIASSPARVEVYGSNGLVASFSPPAITPGNTWRVFEIAVAGSNIEIVPIDVYVTADSYSNINSFRLAGKPSFKDLGIF